MCLELADLMYLWKCIYRYIKQIKAINRCSYWMTFWSYTHTVCVYRSISLEYYKSNFYYIVSGASAQRLQEQVKRSKHHVRC